MAEHHGLRKAHPISAHAVNRENETKKEIESLKGRLRNLEFRKTLLNGEVDRRKRGVGGPKYDLGSTNYKKKIDEETNNELNKIEKQIKEIRSEIGEKEQFLRDRKRNVNIPGTN